MGKGVDKSSKKKKTLKVAPVKTVDIGIAGRSHDIRRAKTHKGRKILERRLP